MSYRKLNKRKKTSKRNPTKSKSTNQRKTRGGNCNSFSNLPIKHYYPMNSYANDVQYQQSSSRLDPNPTIGGKRTFKTKIKKMRTLKTMKKGGGQILSNLSNSSSFPFSNSPSLITNIGNISSAFNGANVLYGYPTATASMSNIPKADYLV